MLIQKNKIDITKKSIIYKNNTKNSKYNIPSINKINRY